MEERREWAWDKNFVKEREGILTRDVKGFKLKDVEVLRYVGVHPRALALPTFSPSVDEFSFC